MAISDILTNLLRAKGENPHALSKKCGVSQPTILRIASGESQDPRRGTLVKIARALNVSVNVFFDPAAAKPGYFDKAHTNDIALIDNHLRRESDKNPSPENFLSADEKTIIAGYRAAGIEGKKNGHPISVIETGS